MDSNPDPFADLDDQSDPFADLDGDVKAPESYGSSALAAARGVIPNLRKSFAGGLASIGQSGETYRQGMQGIEQQMAQAQSPDERRALVKQRDELSRGAGFLGRLAGMTGISDNLAAYGNEGVESAQQDIDAVAPAGHMTPGQQLAHDSISTIGQMAPVIGTALASRGRSLPAMAVSGGQVYGSTYADLVGQHGHDKADQVAKTAALIEGLTEKIPLDRLLRAKGPLWRRMANMGLSESAQEGIVSVLTQANEAGILEGKSPAEALAQPLSNPGTLYDMVLGGVAGTTFAPLSKSAENNESGAAGNAVDQAITDAAGDIDEVDADDGIDVDVAIDDPAETAAEVQDGMMGDAPVEPEPTAPIDDVALPEDDNALDPTAAPAPEPEAIDTEVPEPIADPAPDAPIETGSDITAETVAEPEPAASDSAPVQTEKPHLAGKPIADRPQGADVTILTPDANNNQEIAAHWRVVEASDLITSHDKDGKENPNYPQELQPRDRSKSSSVRQIDAISKNPQFRRLAESVTSDQGAPIVSADGHVESGNGRSIGLAAAYGRDPEAAGYRAELAASAGQFGIDPALIEGMSAPVLVRVRDSEVDPVAFARASNKGSINEQSPAEKATADRDYINLDTLADDDLQSASNRGFINGFINALPEAERAGMLDKRDRPTKQAYERATSAIFSAAYGDSEHLVRMQSEEADVDVRNLLSAMTISAKSFAKAAELSDQGAEVVASVVEAADIIVSAKQKGMRVDEFVTQGDMISSGTELGRTLALFVDQNKRSPKQMGIALKGMADEVAAQAEHNAAGDMFGGAESTLEDLPEQTNRRLDHEGETKARFPAKDKRGGPAAPGDNAEPGSDQESATGVGRAAAGSDSDTAKGEVDGEGAKAKTDDRPGHSSDTIAADEGGQAEGPSQTLLADRSETAEETSIHEFRFGITSEDIETERESHRKKLSDLRYRLYKERNNSSTGLTLANKIVDEWNKDFFPGKSLDDFKPFVIDNRTSKKADSEYAALNWKPLHLKGNVHGAYEPTSSLMAMSPSVMKGLNQLSGEMLLARKAAENPASVEGVTPEAAMSLETLAHEYGHAIKFHSLMSASEKIRRAVFADYEKWRAKTKTGGKASLSKKAPAHVYDMLSRENSPSLEKIEGHNFGAKHDQYLKSFVEWYADQVANALVKRTVEGQSSITKLFMGKVAGMLKRFYAAIAKHNTYQQFNVAPSVEAMLDALAGKENSQFTTEVKADDTGFRLESVPVQGALFNKEEQIPLFDTNQAPVKEGDDNPQLFDKADLDKRLPTKQFELDGGFDPGLAQRSLFNKEVKFDKLDAEIEKVLSRAEKALPKMTAEINELADTFGARPMVGPVKKLDRSREKIVKDYGGDVSKLKDALRATLVVKSAADVSSLYAELGKRGAVQKVDMWAMDDQLSTEPGDAGYRQAMAYIKVDGMLAEVQINTEPMLEAKNGEGHKLYVKARSLPAGDEQNQLIEQMKSVYDQARKRSIASSRVSTPDSLAIDSVPSQDSPDLDQTNTLSSSGNVPQASKSGSGSKNRPPSSDSGAGISTVKSPNKQPEYTPDVSTGPRQTVFFDQTFAFDQLDQDQRQASKKFAEPGGKDGPTWLESARNRLGLRIRQAVVDRYAALLEILDKPTYGEDVVEDSIQQSSWALARMSNASTAALNVLVTGGRIRYNEKQKVLETIPGNTDSLESVLNELGNSGEINRFLMWIAGNRAKKLKSEGRENLFTDKDIAAMTRMHNGAMEDGRNRRAQYAKTLAKFNRIRKDVLDIAKTSGMVDAANADAWANDFYVPFYREIEDWERSNPGSMMSGDRLAPKDVIKKLKGGKDQLKDPLENLVNNFQMMLDQSMKNIATRQAIENAERVGIAKPVGPGEKPKHKVAYFEGGRKQFYSIEPVYTGTSKAERRLAETEAALVFEAITMTMSPPVPTAWTKWPAAFKRVFTDLTTLTPAFAITNLIRDAVAVQATSPVKAHPLAMFTNTASGMAGYSNKAKRNDMLASGGVFSGSYDNLEDTVQMVRTKGDEKGLLRATWDLSKAGMNGYRAVLTAAENASRVAAYEQTLKRTGGNKLAAAFAGRDVVDFSAHGAAPFVRFMMKTIPFLNARIQGLEVQYRKGVKAVGASVTGKGSRHQKQMAMRYSLIVSTLAIGAVYLRALGDEDEVIEALPEWHRDAYYTFRIGDRIWSLPKPFEVGAWSTIAERSYQAFRSDNPEAGKLFRGRLLHMLTETFAFDPIGFQITAPIKDVLRNHDSFRDSEIIPEWQMSQDYPSYLLGGSATSSIAQWGSKALYDMGVQSNWTSPPVIDHMVGGYFSTIGSWALAAGDMVGAEMSGVAQPAKRVDEWAANPARRFYRHADDQRGSKYVDRFYESMKRTAEKAKEMDLLMKSQIPTDHDRAQKQAEKNQFLIGADTTMQDVKRRLSDINKEIRAIRGNPDIGKDEKRSIIRSLQRGKAEMAKEADKMFQQVLKEAG